MGRFENDVVIVTGGSQGQGSTHVRAFINEGAKVVFTDILTEKGKSLEKELGKNALFIQQDVSNEQQWNEVINKTEEAFGPITVLVNNAGIPSEKSILDITTEEYIRVINVNQLSVFLGMKYVIPSMQRAGRGSIINVSSINGLRGGPMGTVAYEGSKFAVRGMTKSAALMLASQKIRVNSVHPGYIETPMLTDAASQEVLDGIAQMTPMKRLAKPEEITNLVLFLASDESSFSTGSEFIADGGLTAGY